MDELLALMDDEGSVEEEKNELTSLEAPIVEHQNEKRASTNTTQLVRRNSPPTRNNTKNTRSVNPDLSHAPSNTCNESQGRVDLSIDQKLGFRMYKRSMSSVDLLDLVSTHPYHSTASLSASSLAVLNKLLVEPTSVVSAATVSGKMNIVAVGIVLENSGTRISQNGRAFCLLKIGNLETGPVVTVFLFGEAYSKYCSKCPPGTVIAVVMPNLLPPKDNMNSRDATTISLSVNTTAQLIPVAQARDYGVCKGTVSAKRPDGTWVSNGGRCKQFVDTRKSQYCDKHRKQQQNSNKKQAPTFMQQQRMAQTAKVSVVRGPSLANQGVLMTHKPRASANDSIEAEFAALSHLAGGRFHNAPIHAKKQGTTFLPVVQATKTSGRSRFAHRAVNASVAKPLVRSVANATASVASRPTATRQGTSQPGSSASQPVYDDWLNPKSSSKRPLNGAGKKKTPLVSGKKRAVNRDTGGFDGSVPIPKRSKLFRKEPIAPQARSAVTTTTQNALSEAKVDAIRQQQRLVAERQKENAAKQGSLSIRNGAARVSPDDSLRDSLFGSFKSVDTEQVLAAKSRFADEADAEAYAKSRSRVADLERREEQNMQSEKKKQKAASDSVIQKEWVCTTCGKKSKQRERLGLCTRAGHKVEFKRSLKMTDTVQERRLKLDQTSVEDGGLKLGAGLEWDRRSRF